MEEIQGSGVTVSNVQHYQMDNIDCIQGMKKLDENSVDVVVTSPPYNLGIEYGTYKDDLKREDYLNWSLEWATEVFRVLKENGSFFLNIGASPKDPLLPHQIALEYTKLFFLQNTFHWIKSISVQRKNGEIESTGHFKPINSKRFVTDCHEYIFHFTKRGNVELDRLAVGVPYVHKSNINRWKHTEGSDKRCRGNTWFIPYQTINSRIQDRPHPATYPVELAENCLKIHGINSDSVVMDPFLGIGHTAQAALNCGVSHFIGFDIDEIYLSEARKMISPESDNPVMELFDLESKSNEAAAKKKTAKKKSAKLMKEVEDEDSQQMLF